MGGQFECRDRVYGMGEIPEVGISVTVGVGLGGRKETGVARTRKGRRQGREEGAACGNVIVGKPVQR